MKFLIVLSAILAVSLAGKINIEKMLNELNNEVIKDGSSEEDLGALAKEIRKELIDFSEELGNKICENKGKDIKQALTTMFDCIENHPDDELLCDMYLKNFVPCMKPVEEMLTNCVAKNYHDLPKMIMQSMSNTVEFVCNAQGKELVELVNPCGRKNHENMMKCVPDDFSMENLDNAKTSMCKMAMDSKECLMNEIKNSCKHELTRKAHEDLWDAVITNPCKMN